MGHLYNGYVSHNQMVILKTMTGDWGIPEIRTSETEVLLACVSPARSNFDESVSTLEFAALP
jgi:hypothetical protein